MLRRWNKISGWKDVGHRAVALCAWRVGGEDRMINPSLVYQDFSHVAFPKLVFTGTGWADVKEALSRLIELNEDEPNTALCVGWALDRIEEPLSSLEELESLISEARERAKERWGDVA